MTNPTNPMLERAARAAAGYENGDGFDDNWEGYTGLALAVLRAIREPDHDMTATVVKPGDDRTEACRIWQAMLDHITGDNG
jgi:hypothetical protein